jgi:peptidoglycan/LPS O-acetylase OafA/YrhL
LTTGFVRHTRFNLGQIGASYLFLPAHGFKGDITPVIGVGWTLNFEMFFYLLFTLALFLNASVYKFVGAILVPLAVGAFFRQPNWPAVSFYLDTRVLLFFYGMIVAKICLSGRHLPKALAVPLLGLGFLGLAGPWSSPPALHALPEGIAAFLIVYSMASLEDSLTRIPLFILFGADASYAIYLFHPFIAPAVPVALLHLHLVHPWLSVACSVLLALAGGSFIHVLVEAPLSAWFRNHLYFEGKKFILPALTA